MRNFIAERIRRCTPILPSCLTFGKCDTTRVIQWIIFHPLSLESSSRGGSLKLDHAQVLSGASGEFGMLLTWKRLSRKSGLLSSPKDHEEDLDFMVTCFTLGNLEGEK